MCLGAALARLEAQVAIGTLVQRFPGIKPQVEPQMDVSICAGLTGCPSPSSTGVAHHCDRLHGGLSGPAATGCLGRESHPRGEAVPLVELMRTAAREQRTVMSCPDADAR